jgi:hypothetical protein
MNIIHIKSSTVSQEESDEWCRRMRAASTIKIPVEIYNEITTDMKVETAIKYAGKSLLNAYWSLLEVLEAVTALGHWTPQLASDFLILAQATMMIEERKQAAKQPDPANN